MIDKTLLQNQAVGQKMRYFYLIYINIRDFLLNKTTYSTLFQVEVEVKVGNFFQCDQS